MQKGREVDKDAVLNLTLGLSGLASHPALPRLTHTKAYLNWLASDRWMRWH